MVINPSELKVGQFIIFVSAENSNKFIGSGKVMKHISGIPYPSVMIKWDNGNTEIEKYSAIKTWWNVYVANTEQEKLALLMKLS